MNVGLNMSNPTTARKTLGSRNSSRETLYSSNPTCLLQKRKPAIHPLAASIRVNTRSNVQQRVLSAKLLKLKQLQNQLNDANYHLAELQQENRALKTLQARQDKALSKYEGTNAELPKLLQSYEEEIRVLQSKNKTLRKGFKEACEQIKIKDEEINNLREQLKHLMSLSKNKHLEDREKLLEQIEELKRKLQKSEEEIKNLKRKSIVDNKNYKYKINTEISKTKQYQKELEQALNQINNTNMMARNKNLVNPSQNKKRFQTTIRRQSVSLVNLDKDASLTDRQSVLEEEVLSTDSKEDIALEPIIAETNSKIHSDRTDHLQNGYLESPSDKIKARLSGNKEETDSKIPTYAHFNSSSRSVRKETETTFIESNFGKLNISEVDVKSIHSNDKYNVNETTISIKQLQKDRNRLNMLGESLKSSIRKGVQLKDKYALDENLEGYCTSVINSVNKCNDNLEKQVVSFQQSKTEMDKVLNELEKADEINKKLTSGTMTIVDSLEITSKDADIVNKILKDEYTFQKEVKKDLETTKKYDLLLSATKLSNQVEREPEVDHEDKRKLLETLKAIDDGDDIEFAEKDNNNTVKKNNLMKELFGQATK